MTSAAKRPSPLQKPALPLGIAGFLLLLGAVSCGPTRPKEIRLAGETMGTTYSVIYLTETAQADPADDLGIKARLESINSAMTTYADSEVTRFNASKSQAPTPMSADTTAVLEISLQIGRATNGALDITIGPIVRAFGFGPDRASEIEPDELTALRAHVGLDLLELSSEGLSKKHPETEIDLSAIAKGYAVDEVARLLEAYGIERYLVEVGGELRASGNRADGTPWRVGIERPEAHRGQLHRSLPLPDLSIATSGDYRNYREVDGRRISHIFDPRTGETVSHRTASVTVLSGSCAQADGFATALMVLGEEDGLAIARAQNIAALFLVRQKDGSFLEATSPAMKRLLESAEALSP